VKRKPTSTHGKPALDGVAFQQLLGAVYILQEHHNRLLNKEPKADCDVLSDGAIAENVRPIQQGVPPTPVAIPVLPAETVIPVAQADVEPLAPQYDSVISPDTVYQLSVLASRLEALIQQQIRTNSEWTARLPVAVGREIPAEEQQAVAYRADGRESAGFEQPQSEPAQLMPLAQSVVPSGTSILSARIVRRRVFHSNELFLRTAAVVAVAAVLFMLLSASVHRFLPAPGGLVLSSEAPPQQTPSLRTNATESLAAAKAVEPTVVADRLPPSVENSGLPQKRVVKSNSLHSTYRGEADLVAGNTEQLVSEVQNGIRADRRLQKTEVQVRARNGIIILFGDVGSEAERVAAAQDAARIGGIEALVNNLRVITNPQSPTSALQKPSASVASIARAPAGESSPAEANRSSSSRPKDSRVFDVSSRPSPVLTSAMKTLLSEPEQIIVPYGTGLAVRLTENLSSARNQPGDAFFADLAAPIVIGNRVIVPEGAGVTGRIVDARNARRFGGRSALVIELTQLAFNGRTYELRSSQYSKQGASRNAYAAAAITAGTGVGAVIGTVLGRGKGTAIGAVLGAAAGTGVQAVTKSAAAELSAESTLSLRLRAPLKVITSSAAQRVQSAGPPFLREPLSSDDRPALKHRAGSPLPDTNTNASGPSPTSNKSSQQAPSSRQN
jgi:BON domain